MTDERYKQLMADIGMPNSRSLLGILQQVANEVAQEWSKRLDIVSEERDCLKAELAEALDLLKDISKFKPEIEDPESLLGWIAIIKKKAELWDKAKEQAEELSQFQMVPHERRFLVRVETALKAAKEVRG